MNKSPGPDVFMGECQLTFKEDSIPSLKQFQKFLEGTLPDSCCETLITLTPKQEKDATRNVQANIPDEYRCKDADLNTSKLNLAAH